MFSRVTTFGIIQFVQPNEPFNLPRNIRPIENNNERTIKEANNLNEASKRKLLTAWRRKNDKKESPKVEGWNYPLSLASNQRVVDKQPESTKNKPQSFPFPSIINQNAPSPSPCLACLPQPPSPPTPLHPLSPHHYTYPILLGPGPALGSGPPNLISPPLYV